MGVKQTTFQQWLRGTTGQQLYPRYKKTGASLVRLGYHRNLVGGLASRPNLPQKESALRMISHYSSQPGRPYPLNMRVPFQPNFDEAKITEVFAADGYSL